MVSDPIDNEHRNEGFKPSNNENSKHKDNKSSDSWDRVLVDDQYAQENQTLIVKPNYEAAPNYVEPCYPHCGGGGGGGTGDGNEEGGSDSGNDGNSAANTHELEVAEDQNTTIQGYLGYIQMKNQLDGLFRGGTDLRFIFIDVVEVEPGVVEGKRIYRRKDLSRADVSEDRWKELNILVDHRWHSYQKTLPFHVYDIDGNGTETTTIKSELEIADGTTIELESKYEVSDNRDNVGKLFFDRALFLNQNTTGGINGLKDGFRVYSMDRGFSFSLPHETINLN